MARHCLHTDQRNDDLFLHAYSRDNAMSNDLGVYTFGISAWGGSLVTQSADLLHSRVQSRSSRGALSLLPEGAGSINN